MSSSSGVTSPLKAAIQGAKGSASQIVQIVKLPESLQNSAKAIRLEGQVTAQNTSNGTVRIETERGVIDVKIQGNKQPQVGQKIEIDIPPNNKDGRQIRQAVIRNEGTPQNVNRDSAPPQNAGQTIQTPPQNNSGLATKIASSSPAPNTAQVPAQQNLSPTQTQNTQYIQTPRGAVAQSLPPALQEALVTQNTTTIAPTPTRVITPDVTLRLISVPPAQAQNIAKEFIQSLPQAATNIIDKTVFTSNQVAQNILGQASQTIQIPSTQAQVQSLLPPQILQTPIQQNVSTLQNSNVVQPTLILNNNFIGQSQPVQNLSTQQTTILNTTSLINPNQTVVLQPQTQGIITPTPSTVLPTPLAPQSATLTPVSPNGLIFNPSNPLGNPSQQLGQIDINILKIIPPDVVLKPITLGNLPPPSPIPAATPFAPTLIGATNAVALTAQVTGLTAQGLPLITIQGQGGQLPQSFILQTSNTNLQLGSQLQIIPQNGVALSAPTSLVLRQTLNNPLLQGFQWPALDDLYNALQQITPQAASSLARSIPNAGTPSQIGPAAMLFIAAIKSGNFDLLLGDKKIDILQQIGRGGLLKSLTQDRGARAEAPASSGEWRAVPLPMFWESEIHKITLYTRNEEQSQNQEKNQNGQTRFIFDLNLTRMGDVQIDGLLKDKRLDLVLRTQNTFSPPMQAIMRQSYSSALKQGELTGEINFQGSTKNWVHVLEKQAQLGVSV